MRITILLLCLTQVLCKERSLAGSSEGETTTTEVAEGTDGADGADGAEVVEVSDS